MKRTLLFLLFVFCLCFAYWNRYQPVNLSLVAPTIKKAEIKGEVNKPGIYSIKWEATIQDLIEEAGGHTKFNIVRKCGTGQYDHDSIFKRNSAFNLD